MQRLKQLKRLHARLRAAQGLGFVFALSVGYAEPDSTNTEIRFGAYGGTGQVASVLRDCSGNALHAESSAFTEVAGTAQITLRKTSEPGLVIGARSGRWSSDAVYATRSYDASIGEHVYGATSPRHTTFKYFNPYVGIEGEKVGVSLGYMFGDVPISFDDPHERIRFSGSLRLGREYRPHFFTRVAEGLPLYSGGGVFDIGFVLPSGKHARFYSAFTAGFYDRMGYLQTASWRVSKGLWMSASGRIGAAGDKFEGAISIGLQYRFLQ